jgi:hypothetical protein
LTFIDDKLHQRQKDLQSKIDTKISNEIYNVQRVLEVLVKQQQDQNQSQGQETGFFQCIKSIEVMDRKEKQGQLDSNITNTTVKELNKEGIDYKIKTDWYASLLMYNSY